MTEAVAPSLSNCLGALPQIPQLGDLLEAGSWGGRSPTAWPPVQAKPRQQRPSPGTTPAKITAASPSSAEACQACRRGSASLSVSGIQAQTSSDRERLPPGLFASAKVLQPADGDRWNEGGKRESCKKKINNSKETSEFKYR